MSPPRLFDLTCEETACPVDSFCLNDYDRGGSQCHCNLGKGGETCEEGKFGFITLSSQHLMAFHVTVEKGYDFSEYNFTAKLLISLLEKF